MITKKQLSDMWEWGCLRSLRVNLQKAVDALILLTAITILLFVLVSVVAVIAGTLIGALTLLEGISIIVLGVFLLNIVTGTDWTEFKPCKFKEVE